MIRFDGVLTLPRGGAGGAREAHIQARRSKSSEEEYDAILRESIVDGLKYLFGEGPARAVLHYLGSPESTDSPQELSGRVHSIFIHSIFGQGSEIVEKVIVKDLFRKLTLSFEDSASFDFSSYTTHAKEMFLANSKRFEQDE